MGEVLFTLLLRPIDEAVGRQIPCHSVEAEHDDRPATAIIDGLVHLAPTKVLYTTAGDAGQRASPLRSPSGIPGRFRMVPAHG